VGEAVAHGLEILSDRQIVVDPCCAEAESLDDSHQSKFRLSIFQGHLAVDS
jgi:hypothetical protein